MRSSSIGCLPASTYVTPGWLRTAWIWDFVPTAPTTPILRKVVDVVMPVAVTADVAACEGLAVHQHQRGAAEAWSAAC